MNSLSYIQEYKKEQKYTNDINNQNKGIKCFNSAKMHAKVKIKL